MPKSHPFISFFSEKKICHLRGKIVGNPVKIENPYGRAFYKTVFKTEFSGTKTGRFCSTRGQVVIYFPASLVEMHYPGRLYTDAQQTRGTVVVESGESLNVKGKFSQSGIFYVDNAVMARGGNLCINRIIRLRSLSRIQLKRCMYAWGGAGGLLLALLSGSREYTEHAVSDAFRNAGLAHILALSGMHLALFSGMAFSIGKLLGNIRIACILKILSVCVFVWFAGFSPSLFRAFLCNIILLAVSLAGIERPSMLDILSLSFLFHAFLAPDDLTAPAFLLSYSALLGIFIFGKTVQRFLVRYMPYHIADALSSSTGAQLCTAPISLCLFGSVMPGGIIAGIIVTPLVVFFLYTGLAGIVLSLCFPFLSDICGNFMKALYFCIKTAVLTFARLPSIEIVN